MGGINVKIHPLFFLFGVYYAATGRIFLFAIYTICAVGHELAHSVTAQKLGYKLNEITLMPFGAVASGDIDGLKLKDQTVVALAGPLFNLAVGIACVAAWWIFPDLYAFTDMIAEANLSMAAINFIPVFPLDGGRVLQSFVSARRGREKSLKICKIIGVAFSVLLAAAFVLTCFNRMNLSILFFAAFVFFGALSCKKENRYVKVFSGETERSLLKGAAVKHFAVDGKIPVKKLFFMLDGDGFNVIDVYKGDKLVKRLSQFDIKKITERADIYSPLDKYIGETTEKTPRKDNSATESAERVRL